MPQRLLGQVAKVDALFTPRKVAGRCEAHAFDSPSTTARTSVMDGERNGALPGAQGGVGVVVSGQALRSVGMVGVRAAGGGGAA